MKSLIFFLFLTGLVFCQTPEELDRTVRRLAPDLVDATVAIMLDGGSGSGVIVSPQGLVITAAHVTNEPFKQMKVLLSDGRELPATSLGVDHETDGALLQINAPGPFPYRPYVETKTYKIGDWVIATGHPGGPVVGRPAPVRLGRISEAGIQSGFNDAITTSAMVISGDSGGPLYNLKGEVIGINSNISGSWRINRHVPLPSIVARWDELMAGEAFGRSMQVQKEPADLFNEPYAELRDRFEKALAKNAENDPEAMALLKRPRLLDPHHMQKFLDRWEPDPEAPKSPQYGFQLEGRVPRITSIVPGSPAAESELVTGDTITEVNGEGITSTTDLALILRKGGIVSLTTNSGKTAELKPVEVTARKHFPQPVAGVIDMIVIEPSDGDNGPARVPAKDFMGALEFIREKYEKSVVPIKDGRGKILVSATVIHEVGQLLTKASEIEEVEGLTLSVDGQDYPVTIMAVDEETDLALISVNATGLIPVRWEPEEPKVGQLLVTPGGRGLLTGVVTQPGRDAPKKGYELDHTSEKPSAYLGVTFSAESSAPVIESIELGSPADKIGILEGDEIIKFEGAPVSSIEALAELLTKRSPGEKVELLVKRGKEEVKLKPILDIRPATAAGSFDRQASQRDGRLSSLSARGGELSKRRDDFPYVLYHDQPLSPRLTGTPLVNLTGDVVGINIARAMRHRSLALPTLEIDSVVTKLRDEADDN
jgi:S1-C subfamily serine protease